MTHTFCDRPAIVAIAEKKSSSNGRISCTVVFAMHVQVAWYLPTSNERCVVACRAACAFCNEPAIHCRVAGGTPSKKLLALVGLLGGSRRWLQMSLGVSSAEGHAIPVPLNISASRKTKRSLLQERKTASELETACAGSFTAQPAQRQRRVYKMQTSRALALTAPPVAEVSLTDATSIDSDVFNNEVPLALAVDAVPMEPAADGCTSSNTDSPASDVGWLSFFMTNTPSFRVQVSPNQPVSEFTAAAAVTVTTSRLPSPAPGRVV